MISASVPVYLILAGVLTSSFTKRARLWVFAGILIFLLTGSGLYLQGLTKTKFWQGFREAAAHLDREAAPSDLVLVGGAGGTLPSLTHYLKSDLDIAAVETIDHIVSLVKDRDTGPTRVWLLAAAPPPPQTAHQQILILDWLQTHFKQTRTKSVEHLDLILFSPR